MTYFHPKADDTYTAEQAKRVATLYRRVVLARRVFAPAGVRYNGDVRDQYSRLYEAYIQARFNPTAVQH